MFSEIKRIVQSDRRLQWILLGGLIIQLITAVTAIGTASADQHFQIIEFSLYQLGKPSGASYVWEISHFVRPTLQVYLFSGYHLTCNFLGITDPYTQLTILRVLLALVMFAVFNAMALYYFRNGSKKILLYVLLLMNFTWILPYTRTLYCSEMMGSLFFFATIFLYDVNKDRNRGFLFLVLVGFLFSLTFYFRFQMASAMLAFGIWLIFVQKKYKHILPLLLGFAIGVVLNVYLDHGFYKEWVFTPYTYFYANINDGRAQSFGTSSFTRYIGLLLAVMPAPLFSIIFFYYSIKTFFKKYTNLMFLSVVLFVVAHCMVGHKEERFLYPVFNVLPLIIGWSIPELEKYYAVCKRWIRGFLKGLLVFTVVINTFFLLAFAFVPYSQTIHFSYLLKNKFDGAPVTLHCYGQTPFESPSRIPMEFYKIGVKNIALDRFDVLDSLALIQGSPLYFTSTYNHIKDRRQFIDSLGYKPVMYSSNLLWGINEFLNSKKINTINDIWVLYKKEQ